MSTETADLARIDRGLALLEELGFNLSALLSVERLHDELPEFTLDRTRFGSVLLIGSAGRGLWASVTDHGLLHHADPVDEHTRRSIQRFCVEHLGPAAGQPAIDHELAWPNAEHREVPVMGLGSCAGWHHQSPLGLGVHPVHGLWFAYRAVILLAPSWPERRLESTTSPCETCDGKPCIVSCPADVLSDTTTPDLAGCFEERTRQGAICQHLCVSRAACPVGANSRYLETQVEHHHRFAILGWKRSVRPE